MIVLLNLVTVILCIAAISAAIHFKKVWPLILGLVVLLGYNMIQPSYMPKGTVPRDHVPAFEEKDLEIRNIQLQPKSSEQYNTDREQAIQKGLPFIEK